MKEENIFPAIMTGGGFLMLIFISGWLWFIPAIIGFGIIITTCVIVYRDMFYPITKYPKGDFQ